MAQHHMNGFSSDDEDFFDETDCNAPFDQENVT